MKTTFQSFALLALLFLASCGAKNPAAITGKKIAEQLCLMPAAENDAAKMAAIKKSIDEEAKALFESIYQGKKPSELSIEEKAKVAKLQAELLPLVKEEAKKCGLSTEQIDLYFATGGMKKVNFEELLTETKGLSPMQFKNKNGAGSTEIYTQQTPEKTIVWELIRNEKNEIVEVNKSIALNTTINFCTVQRDTVKNPNTDGSFVAYAGEYYLVYFCPDLETAICERTRQGRPTTKDKCLMQITVPFSTLEQGQAFVNSIKAQQTVIGN